MTRLIRLAFGVAVVAAAPALAEPPAGFRLERQAKRIGELEAELRKRG